MIVLKFITSLIVTSLLYSNIVWAIPGSLQPNSAFDNVDPRNNTTRGEMADKYSERAGLRQDESDLTRSYAKAILSLKADSSADVLLLSDDPEIRGLSEISGASREEIANMFMLIKNPSSSKAEINARQEMVRTLISGDRLEPVSNAKDKIYVFLGLIERLIKPEGENPMDRKPFAEKLLEDPDFDLDRFKLIEYKPKKGTGAERVINTLISIEKYKQAVEDLIKSLRETGNGILTAIADELEMFWQSFPAKDAAMVAAILLGKDSELKGRLHQELKNLKTFVEKIGGVILFAGIVKGQNLSEANFNESGPVYYSEGWNFVRKKEGQVRNDSGSDALVRLITGSNMSGKSHFLAQNLFIQLTAQSFGYVPAGRENNLRIYGRIAYIDRASTDSTNNLSAFGQEVERWKKAFDKEPDNRTLVISDEAFSTTSPMDQFKLLRAVKKYISRRRARIILANHNEEFIKSCIPDTDVSIYHLKVEVNEDGTVKLLYELKEGPDDSRALYIARRLGFPPEIIQSAENYLAGKRVPVEARNPETLRQRSYSAEERGRLKQEIGNFMRFFPHRNTLVVDMDKKIKWRYRFTPEEGMHLFDGSDRDSLNEPIPEVQRLFSLFSRDPDFASEWGGMDPEEYGLKRYSAIVPLVQTMLQQGGTDEPAELMERQGMFRALGEKGVFEGIEDAFKKLHNAMYVFAEGVDLINEHYSDFNIFLLDSSYHDEKRVSFFDRDEHHEELFFAVLMMNIRLCGIDVKGTGIEEKLELIHKLKDLRDRYEAYTDAYFKETEGVKVQDEAKERQYMDQMARFEEELVSLVGPVKKDKLLGHVYVPDVVRDKTKELTRDIYDVVKGLASPLSLRDEALRDKLVEEIGLLLPMYEKVLSQSVFMNDTCRMIMALKVLLNKEDVVSNFLEQLRGIDSVYMHQLANYFEILLRHWFRDIKTGYDYLEMADRLKSIEERIKHFEKLADSEPFEKIMERYIQRIVGWQLVFKRSIEENTARKERSGWETKMLKDDKRMLNDLQYTIDLYELEEGKKPKRDKKRIKGILKKVIQRFEISQLNRLLWEQGEKLRFNHVELGMIWKEFEKFLAIILYGYVIREFGFAEVEYTDDLEVRIEKGWSLTMGRKDVWKKEEKDERNIRDRQVRNDVTFGPAEIIKILSGSNMSGKTFLEKMIVWNMLSAHVSGFSPSAGMRMPVFSRIIYLDRVTAKMFRDLSSYGHEVLFWREFFKLFEGAEGPVLVLGITDEVFSTTSPLYQSALSYGVAEEVLRRGGLMVVASHNHDFIEAFKQSYPDKTRIWHLKTRIEREDGGVKVYFDHVLEEGHDLSNAIDIAESMGLGMITALVKEEEAIRSFLTTTKIKGRRCKDIDEELVIAVDTDIGNLKEYAGELMAELVKLNIDNVRVFIGPGAELKEQLQKYSGDRKNCVINAVLKNSNCSLFEDVRDRIRITAVEDSDSQANYIPIIQIIELAIRQAMGEDVTQDYRWFRVKEMDGMLIIYLLPEPRAISVDELRERYRDEAVVLASA